MFGCPFRSPKELENRKVTVMGLGLFGGGAGVVRFLVDRGARVTVTDLRTADVLEKSLDQLEGLPVRHVLGEHREEDFETADLIVANPAVPPDSPYLQAAARAGVPVESEINLTFRFLPTPFTVGVTGSNGKTTTSHLIHTMVKACGRRSWLGGNMGGSLLPVLDEIRDTDVVVLELSSFQLETTGEAGLGPRVAVLTNITPNHLDRHGTFEAYAAAKRQIFLKAQGAVLNASDPETAQIVRSTGSMRKIFFSSREALGEGISLEADRIVSASGGQRIELVSRSEVVLPGIFNVENIMAALGALSLILERDKIPPEAVRAGAAFEGVPHRLETVAMKAGVRYINDSIATTPESTIAAVEALGGEIALIAGGYDKGIPLEGLARRIIESVRVVYLIGATAGNIEEAIRRARDGSPQLSGSGPEVVRAGVLGEAVRLAADRAGEGWTVLLSPAFASYDQFIHFEQRGEVFRECVAGLPGKSSETRIFRSI